MDKSIINSIRRILLSRIPSVAFVTKSDGDLIVNKNNTSLHNEFLLHRISLIPLYIDPEIFNKGLLFHLKIENNSNQLKPVTAKDFNIYKIKPSIMEECRKQNDYSVLSKISMDSLYFNFLSPKSFFKFVIVLFNEILFCEYSFSFSSINSFVTFNSCFNDLILSSNRY